MIDMEQAVPPRVRRSERQRMRILDAAETMLRESGPDRLALRALAARVELAASALYTYFRDKDELLRAIVDRAVARLAERIPRAGVGRPPRDRLVDIALECLRFVDEEPQTFALIRSIAARDPAWADESPGVRALIAALEDAVREAVGPSGLARSGYVSLIHGLCVVTGGPGELGPADRRRLVERTVRGLISAFDD